MLLYTFYRKYIWLLRIIAFFFMGLIAAFVIMLSQLDLESLRGNILSVLRDTTNMPIEIDGKMSWHFSLHPEIEFNDVRIPNADWAKNKNMFSAQKIYVRLDLLSLFKSHPVIRYIKISDAKISIEQNAKGENSVVFNNLENPEDKPYTEDTGIEKYPIKQLPFGGLSVDNFSVDIYGKKYKLTSFGIANYMRHGHFEYSGWVKPYDTNLPFVAQFSEYNEDKKIYPVRIAFSTGGEPLIADITLDGTSKLPIDFVISGEIPNIQKSGKWFYVNVVKLPKLKIDTAFSIGKNKINFRKSSVALNDLEIKFSGTYDWSAKTPKLNANISSDMVNIYKTFPEWFGAGSVWVHPNRDLNVFHDMPLFGQYMYNLDADIDVNLKHFIVYRSLDLSNLKAKVKIKNNEIDTKAGLNIGGGHVDVVLLGDVTRDGTLNMVAAGHGNDIYVGEILRQIYINKIISGLPLDLDLYVRANGKNMSEIMQTMTGPVMVYSVGNGFAHADLVEYMYGGDFLTTLRHSVQDLFTDKQRDMIEIDSAIANVKLRNGLIETQNGVAVETHIMNLRLAGTVDLGKETIQLSLASVPVRGLKLSLSGNIVNSMQITGNLAEPDFKISGAAVAGKVGSAVGIGLLLAPLTGGLSIAGGFVAGLLAGDLLESWLADDKPYETAKTKGAPRKPGDPLWMDQPLNLLVESVFNAKNL